MKVDNHINYPMMINQHKPKYGLENNSKSASGELCNNKNVNRGYYSGSSVSFGAAASFSSRMLDKLIAGCNNHTTIVQNLVALVLALGPRPLAILSLPGKKNKEDKIYASGHSMASGLIGFGFASVIMYPLGKAAQKVKENDAQLILDRFDKSSEVKLLTRRLAKISKQEEIKPEDLSKEKLYEGVSHLEDEFLEQFGTKTVDENGKLTGLSELKKGIDYEKVYNDYNEKNLSKSALMKGTKWVKERFLDNFAEFGKDGKFIRVNKKLDFDMVFKGVNMAPDTFVFGIVKAMLTVALIPPILKYVFGIEKGKKPQQAPQTQQVASVQSFKQRPSIETIGQKSEGGVK